MWKQAGGEPRHETLAPRVLEGRLVLRTERRRLGEAGQLLLLLLWCACLGLEERERLAPTHECGQRVSSLNVSVRSATDFLAHFPKCRCLLAASFLVQGETIWSVGDWNEDCLRGCESERVRSA